MHIYSKWREQVFQQLINTCRERGARKVSVSCGNYTTPVDISGWNADICFYANNAMQTKQQNFRDHLPPPGKLLFVMQADRSIAICQGDYVTNVSTNTNGKKSDQIQLGILEGCILGQLLGETHPVMAARFAMHVSLSYENDQQIIQHMPSITEMGVDERVAVNPQQVEKIAQVVKIMPEAQAFDYAGEKHPMVGHPHAVDYFFAVTLQQFGFWEDDGRSYQRPMIANLGGQQLKGSAYMAQAFYKKIDAEPDFYTPNVQANLSEGDLLAAMRSDDGDDPLPAIALHLQVANRFGRDLLALGLTPHAILESVNAETKPLAAFIHILDNIGGYKEDPFRKKSNLLAMILSQRPEGFLRKAETENLLPVVDYHCMRACLRLGLIDVLDETLREKLIHRQLVTADEEWAIRFAAYQIQAMVEELSGKSIGVVDWFFFNYMRSRCFEMTAPECTICAANQVCLHREQLFQPVFRTTHY